MHFEVYISGHFLFIRSGKEEDDKKYKDIRLVHLIFFLGSVYVLFLVFKNSTFYWAMVYDTYTRFSVYSSSSDEESVTRRYVLLTSPFQRFAIYIIYHNHVSGVVHFHPLHLKFHCLICFVLMYNSSYRKQRLTNDAINSWWGIEKNAILKLLYTFFYMVKGSHVNLPYNCTIKTDVKCHVGASLMFIA